MNKLHGLTNATPKYCQLNFPLFQHTITQTQDQSGICSGVMSGMYSSGNNAGKQVYRKSLDLKQDRFKILIVYKGRNDTWICFQWLRCKATGTLASSHNCTITMLCINKFNLHISFFFMCNVHSIFFIHKSCLIAEMVFSCT